MQEVNIISYFELQCLCFSGFYTKKDSLILFTTGGRIGLEKVNRELVILKSMKLKIIIIIISIKREQGITSMRLLNGSEEALQMNGGTIIRTERVITITTFIMFIKANINMDERRMQESQSKSTWRGVRMTILGITEEEIR